MDLFLIIEVSVKFEIDGLIEYEVVEGDGLVNVLDGVFCKVLEFIYFILKIMRFVDYKVCVVNGEVGMVVRI